MGVQVGIARAELITPKNAVVLSRNAEASFGGALLTLQQFEFAELEEVAEVVMVVSGGLCSDLLGFGSDGGERFVGAYLARSLDKSTWAASFSPPRSWVAFYCSIVVPCVGQLGSPAVCLVRCRCCPGWRSSPTEVSRSLIWARCH